MKDWIEDYKKLIDPVVFEVKGFETPKKFSKTCGIFKISDEGGVKNIIVEFGAMETFTNGFRAKCIS